MRSESLLEAFKHHLSISDCLTPESTLLFTFLLPRIRITDYDYPYY